VAALVYMLTLVLDVGGDRPARTPSYPVASWQELPGTHGGAHLRAVLLMRLPASASSRRVGPAPGAFAGSGSFLRSDQERRRAPENRSPRFGRRSITWPLESYSRKGRAMTPARTEAFSDGVFSIAATLLVLDLKVPTARGDLLSQLLRAWPSYASYVVSFMTIGIIWINHHTIFGHLRHVDRTLQVLNLVLLLTVALTPFPTAVLGAYLEAGHDEAVAGAVYGLAMTAMGASFGTLWAYALWHDSL